MDVETEIVRLSLTSETASALRALAVKRSANINNLADSLLRKAIADTHPKDGDVKQAPPVSGAGLKGIAQETNHDHE